MLLVLVEIYRVQLRKPQVSKLAQTPTTKTNLYIQLALGIQTVLLVLVLGYLVVIVRILCFCY